MICWLGKIAFNCLTKISWCVVVVDPLATLFTYMQPHSWSLITQGTLSRDQSTSTSPRIHHNHRPNCHTITVSIVRFLSCTPISSNGVWNSQVTAAIIWWHITYKVCSSQPAKQKMTHRPNITTFANGFLVWFVSPLDYKGKCRIMWTSDKHRTLQCYCNNTKIHSQLAVGSCFRLHCYEKSHFTVYLWLKKFCLNFIEKFCGRSCKIEL